MPTLYYTLLASQQTQDIDFTSAKLRYCPNMIHCGQAQQNLLAIINVSIGLLNIYSAAQFINNNCQQALQNLLVSLT
jgi:hypothetical protein